MSKSNADKELNQN